jgi:choline dehydrogenase-like flavoprotein
MRTTRSPRKSDEQEIPHYGSRVSIDPLVRDRYGMPVARLRGEAHPATAKAADFMHDRCVDWVNELGGRHPLTDSYPGGSRGAEHSAGTARIGESPATSACDPRGRLHGTSNVYVADASLHPTNGGFNPGLTAAANALRVAPSCPETPRARRHARNLGPDEGGADIASSQTRT